MHRQSDRGAEQGPADAANWTPAYSCRRQVETHGVAKYWSSLKAARRKSRAPLLPSEPQSRAAKHTSSDPGFGTKPGSLCHCTRDLPHDGVPS